MKKIIGLILFLQAALTYGQNSLNGTIMNKQNQEVLPGVLIYCPDLISGVVSDAEGK